MWLLTLIILVNGGESPSKIETYVFTTEARCIAAQHRMETETKIGYCDFHSVRK
jgi:hypothetical protein